MWLNRTDSFLFLLSPQARMFQFTSISLMYEPLRTTLLTTLSTTFQQQQPSPTDIFFDVNLPLPYFRDPELAWAAIQPAWALSTMIEVTKQELEFLLGEDIYEKKRLRQSVYFSKSVEEMKQTTSGREEYHYLPEELEKVWHKGLKILFVTDGTWRVHYYTPFFHGSVAGTEDVLVTPFSCDRTGSGDAVVAGMVCLPYTLNPKTLKLINFGQIIKFVFQNARIHGKQLWK